MDIPSSNRLRHRNCTKDRTAFWPRQFVIPLPPLAEQHRIVAKVDELMTLCDQLEAQLTTTQAITAALLEAVLHQALE